MSDKLERLIEIILSVGTTGGTMYGLFTGYFSGHEAMLIIIASFALYQSTSLAKIFSFASKGTENKGK